MKWLSLEGPTEQHSLGPSSFLTAKFRQNEPYSEKKEYKKMYEQKLKDQKDAAYSVSCVSS